MSDPDTLLFDLLAATLVFSHNLLKSRLQYVAGNRFTAERVLSGLSDLLFFDHFFDFALTDSLGPDLIPDVELEGLGDSTEKPTLAAFMLDGVSVRTDRPGAATVQHGLVGRAHQDVIVVVSLKAV